MRGLCRCAFLLKDVIPNRSEGPVRNLLFGLAITQRIDLAKPAHTAKICTLTIRDKVAETG